MILKSRTSLNWLSLSGLLAGGFYILHLVFGMAEYPGYNWLRQAVSDLTAIDAPSYLVASRFAAIYASLACLCSVVLCVIVREQANRRLRLGLYAYALMQWVSNIGYTLFPLSGSGFSGSFQDVMHFYVVTLAVVLLSILSLVLIIIGGWKLPAYRVLGMFAGLCLFMMILGSIGMGIVPPAYFGLFERFSVLSVVFFTTVLGIFGFVHDSH